jgi:hypothetical protein
MLFLGDIMIEPDQIGDYLTALAFEDKHTGGYGPLPRYPLQYLGNPDI